MLLNSVLQSLGNTAYIPTVTVAWALINHVAFLQSRQYILVGSGEKLVGRVNSTWFHSEKALFDSIFYLLFKPSRNRTEPWETYIDGAFFGSKFGQSVKLPHLLSHKRLDNVLRVSISQ